MEPQESLQADEGEQKAHGLPEVHYTGFRRTQGGYEQEKIATKFYWHFLLVYKKGSF